MVFGSQVIVTWMLPSLAEPEDCDTLHHDSDEDIFQSRFVVKDIVCVPPSFVKEKERLPLIVRIGVCWHEIVTRIIAANADR